MHLLSFILVVFIAFGVHGQSNDKKDVFDKNIEKGYPFGKLRILDDGKTEELIASDDTELPQLNQNTVGTSDVQPLPSPCAGTRPSSKLAYPKDKTKYIFCRDEFHYEILTCPDGIEYNDDTNACDIRAAPVLISRCELEKPCLNNGVCTVSSNSTFKCTCRADWTGDRCETPMTSCVTKPCGPNAECRSLTTNDYEQDYVCICHALRGYGLNCREAVPNPCLTSTEQFYPFAFSPRAYIQCDGELVHFQPCGPLLYWNQEEKICDRKRPTKVDLSVSPTKTIKEKTKVVKQEKFVEDSDEDEEEEEEEVEPVVATTPKQMEREKTLVKNVKQNKDEFVSFTPARVANRHQLIASANNQQGVMTQNVREKEQRTQEFKNQLPQMIDTNQNRQNTFSGSNKWQLTQTDDNMRQPLTVQTERTQLPAQNNQKQWMTASSDRTMTDLNRQESEFPQDSQRPQQQNFQPQGQTFGTKVWLDQIPDTNTQNNQRFFAKSQFQQKSQPMQNQEQFSGDNRQRIFNTEDFEKENPREQVPTWQNKPTNIQRKDNEFFQSTETFQNRPLAQDLPKQRFTETIPSTQNVKQLQGFQIKTSQDQEQPWQQRTNTFATQPQTWQEKQTIGNQPQFQAENQRTSVDASKAQMLVPSQTFQDQEKPWQQKFQTQSQQSFGDASKSQIILPPQDLKEQEKPWQQKFQMQNQQTFGDASKSQIILPPQDLKEQEKPWQQKFSAQSQQSFGDASKSQIILPPQDLKEQDKPWQQKFQMQNQQTFGDASKTQKVLPQQNFDEQEQSWQTTFQKQPVKAQTSQVFAFKPTQRSEPTKQDQTVTSQFQSTKGQQPFATDTLHMKNSQFTFPQQQQQKGQLNLNTFEQTRPNQQFQQGQFVSSTDSKLQSTQDLTARPPMSTQTQLRSQNDQITGDSLESTATIPKDTFQGLSAQNFRSQTSFQPVDQTQFNTNKQFSQPIMTEQRSIFQSNPTKFSG